MIAEEIDVMDWMLTHQLSSKNLSPGEKLSMMGEFREMVAEENEKKKLSSLKQNQSKDRLLQLEGTENSEKNRDAFTDTQVAKRAGVGTGTVARYNKVMNSSDNEIDYITSVLTGP